MDHTLEGLDGTVATSMPGVLLVALGVAATAVQAGFPALSLIVVMAIQSTNALVEAQRPQRTPPLPRMEDLMFRGGSSKDVDARE